MKKVYSYKNIMNDEVGIRLNGNENYKNISAYELEEAIEILKNIKFNRYPDNECIRLREAYANVIGLNVNNIIAGNGSDEMISLIISSLIGKKKSVVTLKPDFSMYDFYTTSNEGSIKKFETAEDGSFSVRDFILFCKKIRPELVIFSNPNNPTGHVVKNEDICTILEELKDTTVVIDEAYYEFYGQSMIQYINKYRNLIVTRTLSKAWGLAAFRIGFLISNEETIKELNNNKVPYNLNQFSQEVACVVLSHPEKILKNVEEIVYEREKLYEKLSLIGNKNSLVFYESKANFIYGRSIYKNQIKKSLERQGITIRYFSDDSFRITVGSPLENKLVVNALIRTIEEGDISD